MQTRGSACWLVRAQSCQGLADTGSGPEEAPGSTGRQLAQVRGMRARGSGRTGWRGSVEKMPLLLRASRSAVTNVSSVAWFFWGGGCKGIREARQHRRLRWHGSLGELSPLGTCTGCRGRPARRGPWAAARRWRPGTRCCPSTPPARKGQTATRRRGSQSMGCGAGCGAHTQGPNGSARAARG